MPLVDYAGIEMRLIVDRAEEEVLIQALRDGVDIHQMMSAVWYGDWVRPAMRWSSADPALRKTLRGAGKNANFAKPYGAAAEKIATTLGLTLEETMPGLKEFCKRWPRVAYFTNISAKKVVDNGHIRTAFHRRLNVQRDTAYAGANYDIQGTAAGILKRAQVRIGQYLRKNCSEVRMILPIHDELIFSFPRKLLPYREEILRNISSIMTTMPEIRVPLEVEWKSTTTTWDAARELKL
jgi:DNA polymerase-1